MAYIYDLTDTWNAGGTTFNAIKMNVTDSASAAASKLVTLQTNGTEHFSVTKAGVGYFSGNVGIGTASPSALLHVKLATNVNARFLNAYSGVALGATTDVGAETKLTFFGDPLAFVTNDAERMRVTSAGNVGIGTSSPGYKLQVASAGGGDAEIVASNTAGAERIHMFSRYSAANSYLHSQNSNLLFGTFDNYQLLIQTNNIERMRITGSGNVGIGTSSPSTKLHVAGDSVTEVRVTTSGNLTTGAASLLRFGGSNSATSGYIGYGGTSSTIDVWNSLAGSLTFGTSNLERMRIDSSGNLLLNTTTAVQPLTIGSGSAAAAGVNLRTTQTDFSITASNTAAGGVTIGTSWVSGGQGPLIFSQSAGERARIDSSGNLLVGTTSVNGDGISIKPRASAGSTSQINFNRASSTTTGYPIVFQNDGTDVGYISHNNTTTTYATSSDARLKHDIVDAPEASSLIDAIKVRSFKWNADNSEQRYGMIAQELLEVAPEAVSHDPDDEEKMMGVDYSKLVPMLVKEIQSLRARVAQLEGN